MAFRSANQNRYLFSLPAPPHIGLSMFCQINETHPSGCRNCGAAALRFWDKISHIKYNIIRTVDFAKHFNIFSHFAIEERFGVSLGFNKRYMR